jgi:signal transduction histidine kinase
VAFDSATPGAAAPFSLADLARRLAPGETLRIQRQDGPAAPVLAELHGREADPEAASPWLTRLILSLPYDGMLPRAAQTLQAEAVVPVFGRRYRLQLSGDLQSVDRGLGATATRLSGYVGAMLAAIALAWLLIERGLIHRVAVLTKRAAALSYNMQDPQVDRRLGDLDVSDLRGRDELGILAGTLAGLLQRVKDGVRREHIRVEQELDMWHAVGHEIMSPLQSLMVLHGSPADPSHRYVKRMQQAVRVLYGSASPSEAIESASLRLDALDLNDFMHHVATNAPFAGIADVTVESGGTALPVVADEHSLEDVVTHVLRNADRHRTPGTPIVLRLRAEADAAVCEIHNQGPPIDPALLESIFEYGVSDAAPDLLEAPARRGQGLFVARTYMAKMAGTIQARNDPGGVSFVLRLPRMA